MPREMQASWEDGIRSLRPDELESLEELLGAVFRPSLVSDCPHVYSRDNAANLRVVVRDGKLISHMGTIRRHACLAGCTVRVACLGGVATLEEHRGQGHATALLDDALRSCREDDVDFMYVSGYRGLYHRGGCRQVGRDWTFTVTRDEADGFPETGIEVALATEADVPDMAAVYGAEPVRWLRPRSDFANALKGLVMNRPARILLLRQGGVLLGYVALQLPAAEAAAEGHILEFAGQRQALVQVLGQLMGEYGLASLDLHVMGGDSLLQGLLRERGLVGCLSTTRGSAMLVNFGQFMERLRPHFVERVGPDLARSLAFDQRDDIITFTCGGDRVVAGNTGQAAELIFGTPGRQEEALLAGGGRAAEVLEAIFPIPSLWYGLNYA